MTIQIKKYGTFLISRPAGREAFLVMRAYEKPQTSEEKIFLDFDGVEVMTPSWLDEVLTGLKSEYGLERVECLPSTNPTVIESLNAINLMPPLG